MLTFSWYVLKVMICSGILYGYYLLALRNKIFHQWNRFYLLTIVILSLAAPLIKINVWQKQQEPSTQVIHFIERVNTNDEVVYEFSKHQQSFHIDVFNASMFIYSIISALLLSFLTQTLLKINYLKRTNRRTVIEGINFFNTEAKGTPFSFFNNIFWNNKIDLNTSSGKQIFKHEVAHVREKHSYDKIFINIVLIIFWCNPIFWLIKKELNMIHEFIADKKAIEDNNTAAFAAMILNVTYPQHQFSITNNFFYSPLKRRLAMLTKNNNPKINYIARLLALPLASLVFFAFTLKLKKQSLLYNGKKITVVIDAGHGGDDNGIAINNVREKDLTLSIAKKIEDLNTNSKIRIILSRAEDRAINVKDRVDFTQTTNADLFISIHINSSLNSNSQPSGLQVLIPGNDNLYFIQSKDLGDNILESFRSNYKLPIENNLVQKEKGVLVLKENKYPAVLVEAGYLTNRQDFDYLVTEENQKIIARNILNAIEHFALTSLQVKRNVAFDTIPEINDASGKNNAENIRLHSEPGKLLPLYILDGKETPEQELNKMNPNGIARIDVLKGEKAIKKYGDKGKNGVIEITTRETSNQIKIQSSTDTIPKNVYNDNMVNVPVYDSTGNQIALKRFKSDATEKEISQSPMIFTQTETPPQFPGGDEAWKRYITRIVSENIKELADENKPGTCRVKFIVHEDGSVSDVTTLSMKGTKLGEISVNAIRKGPKWVPAMQNGHIVAAYKEQPVTFTIELARNDKTVEIGDYILVHLTHANRDVKIKCPITNVGTIFLKGEYVMVKGLLFEDAKMLLKNRFQKIEPNGTEIEISLNKKS